MKLYSLFVILFSVGIINAQNIISSKSFINAPEANRLGGASLAFPIDLPDDVTAFKPDLNIYYNSDAGSSWVGYGFSLGASSISIDDRWGSPIFSSTEESELYSLDGLQLIYPANYLPHRHSGDEPSQYDTSFKPRGFENSSNTYNGKQVMEFQPRRKTTFAIIERIGNSPKNYFWKVTHTNGTIQWFGGDETYQPTNSGNNNFILRDSNKNIVEWGLVKTVDRHGNYIKYTYNKGSYSNLSGTNTNLNGGEFLYLNQIEYTGLQNENGVSIRPPTTRVTLSLSTNSDLRSDVIINAKSGAKKVDARKLTYIKIDQNKNGSWKQVRKYNLTYTVDQNFKKNLLSSISEINDKNKEINKHEFEYYDLVENELFVDYDNIGKHEFGDFNESNPVVGGLFNTIGSGLLDKSKDGNVGWKARLGLGAQFKLCVPNPDLTSTNTFTFGTSFGDNWGNCTSLVGLFDMNGDGLKDFVYKDGNYLKFKPKNNTGFQNNVNSGVLFGQPRTISNFINNFQNSDNSSLIIPFSSFDFRTRFGGFGNESSLSKTDTNIYLTDGNSDMLLDVVKNGQVYFSYIDEDGETKFSKDSSITPNMVITAKPAEEIEADLEWENYSAQINSINNYDAVQIWESFIQSTPVSSDGNQLYNNLIYDRLSFSPTNEDSYINYSVEYYDKSENTVSVIEEVSLNHEYPNHTVRKRLYLDYGDKVFFRTHKNIDSNNEELINNPIIYYREKDFVSDSINYDFSIDGARPSGIYSTNTQYGRDFILDYNGSNYIKNAGTITINWPSLNVENLPSDIEFKIIKSSINPNSNEESEEVIYQRICIMGDDCTIQPFSNQNSINLQNSGIVVNPDIQTFIKFEINTDINIPTLIDIDWRPKIVITSGVTDNIVSEEIYPNIDKKIYRPLKNSMNYNAFSFQSTGSIAELIRHDGIVYDLLGVKIDLIKTIQSLGNLINNNGIYRIVAKNATLGIQDTRFLKINNGNVTIEDENGNSDSSIFIVKRFDNPGVFHFGIYADDKTNTDSLFEVGENLCLKFVVRNISNNQWTEAFDQWNCDPGFNIYGEPKAQLPSSLLGWSQFYYNDNYDQNPNTPVGSFGKLINNDIVENPGLYVDTSFIDGVDIENAEDQEEIDQAINDYFGVPNNPTNDQIDQFLSQFGSMEFSFPYLNGNPVRLVSIDENLETETELWQGLFDSQFIKPYRVRIGDFSNSIVNDIFIFEDEDLPDQEENFPFTQMYAINKKTKTKTKSHNAGLLEVSLSSSESEYSKLLTDFMDLNGDGYPDIILNNGKIQFTKMTGGHNLSTNFNFDGDIQNSKNKVKGLTAKFNYHKALNDFSVLSSSLSSFLYGDYESSIFYFSSNSATPDNEATGFPSLGVNLEFSEDTGNTTTLFWQDINGDGLLDEIMKQDNGTYYFKLNVGGKISNQSNEFLNFNGLTGLNSQPGTLNIEIPLGPINDLVNQGFSNLGLPISFDSNIGGSGTRINSYFADINGDGLVDLLEVGELEGTARINTGNGFNSQSIPIFNMRTSSINMHANASLNTEAYIPIPIFAFGFICNIYVYLKIGAGANIYGSFSINETKKSLVDFDGDGHLDFITVDPIGNTRVYYSNIKTTNKLKSVSNYLGKQFEVDYELIGNTYEMPMGKWVMSDVYYFNGKTGNDNFPIEDATVHDKIEYFGGYYDRRERQFYGYEKLAVKRLANETPFWSSLSQFHNKSYYLNGLLRKQIVVKDDISIENVNDCPNNENVFSCKSNTYTLKKIDSNGDIELGALNYDTGGTEGRGIAIVEMVSSVEKLYQFQNTPLVTTTNFEFDEFSRVVRSELVEEGNISRYYYPNEDNQTALFNQYAISDPIKTETYKSLELLSTAETIYDANADTNGFLLPIELKTSKGSNALEVESTIDLYDSNGNPIQSTDRYGVSTSIIYGYTGKLPIMMVKGLKISELHSLISIESLQNSSNADINANTENTFRNNLLNAISTLNSSENEIVEIKAFTYDENIGVTSEINLNGLITYYVYDNKNRLKFVKDSNGKVLKEFDYAIVNETP